MKRWSSFDTVLVCFAQNVSAVMDSCSERFIAVARNQLLICGGRGEKVERGSRRRKKLRSSPTTGQFRRIQKSKICIICRCVPCDRGIVPQSSSVSAERVPSSLSSLLKRQVYRVKMALKEQDTAVSNDFASGVIR